MSLEHVEHVEAYAILLRVAEALETDPDTRAAAIVWTRENRPKPDVYIDAMSTLARREQEES